MDNINTAIKDKREYSDLNLKEVEPITKINLRGKKREFFTKVGQVLSVILPTESNTSTSNQELSALWLSPDEWMVYTNTCLLYTSPSPRDATLSRMPSSA